MKRTAAVILFLGVLAIVLGSGGRYTKGDDVGFFVNKIGPYSNPTESYEFYSLPFCRPDKIELRAANMGENIIGDTAKTALYSVQFGVDIQMKTLCTTTFTKEQVDRLKQAVSQYYYFEMLYDDLPINGFIGTMDTEIKNNQEVTRYYLYKHLHFSISKNGDRVIQVNVTTDPHRIIELKDDDQLQVEFSYSAKWIDTDFHFEDRMELYQDDFFSQELEIHWLSILNSVVLVILLTGLLALIIIRVLKNDYARYSQEDEDDYGWKLVHGDVFRFPAHKNLFCAFYGLGAQFLSMTFGILTLALLGTFYPQNRGSLYVAAIVLFALCAVISGFVSARMYKQMGGERWSWNIVLVALLFIGPFICVVAVLNTIAIVYDVVIAIPFVTILQVVAIFVLVGFPLNILGGIAGKRSAASFEAPCRTKNFPREIPPIPWYRTLPFQMTMAGFLPFSAIYIELYYIFSSVWGRSSYQLFGILFLVFIILLIVDACITVALTYFQLSMEDHRWWWASFLSGGSTGIFVYIYSVFYFIYRSKMFGFVQSTFYFGYMAVVCYIFFVMLGAVGFFSSLIFVRHIYKELHCD